MPKAAAISSVVMIVLKHQKQEKDIKLLSPTFLYQQWPITLGNIKGFACNDESAGKYPDSMASLYLVKLFILIIIF